MTNTNGAAMTWKVAYWWLGCKIRRIVLEVGIMDKRRGLNWLRNLSWWTWKRLST